MLNIKSKLIPYHASKWLSVALLIDFTEMQSLFNALGNFQMFKVGSVVKKDSELDLRQNFLTHYKQYIDSLKKGNLPEEHIYKSLFAAVLTVDADHVYAMHVGEDGQLIRPLKPVVQMQSHSLDYSYADGKFRAMVFGQDSILWGVQFSYPQLFEDPQTHAVHKVDSSDLFPNTVLFRNLQKWVRQGTVPTPFIVEEKIINVPMRLGKQCFDWINYHPQFSKKKIKVKLPENVPQVRPQHIE